MGGTNASYAVTKRQTDSKLANKLERAQDTISQGLLHVGASVGALSGTLLGSYEAYQHFFGSNAQYVDNPLEAVIAGMIGLGSAALGAGVNKLLYTTGTQRREELSDLIDQKTAYELAVRENDPELQSHLQRRYPYLADYADKHVYNAN